jgi:hypothetical protein
MKSFNKILAGAIALGFLASCSVKGPLMVTNNTNAGKRGEASRTIFLGLGFGHTDLGAITAAKKGKISKIATVDYKVQGGLLTKTYSVIVTGE